MKKKLIFFLCVIACTAVILLIGHLKQQKEDRQKIENYTQQLAGTVYESYSANKKEQYGHAKFYYTLYLEEDGTCKMDFRYLRDKGYNIYSSKEEIRLTFDNLTWSVHAVEKEIVLWLGGEMDWSECPAADLGRTLEIQAYSDGEIISLAGRRDVSEIRFLKED